MRRRLLASGAILAAVALLALIPATVGGRTTNVLEFETMVGVPKAYTGSAIPVRGMSGGGLPWVIGSAKGELSSAGSLELKVAGLVLDPSDPTVISRGLAGNNPIASMRAVVSCLTADGGTSNVATDPFPVTTGVGAGNAKVEAMLSLPSPCIAPIVFVTSTGGAWFATTGH